MDSLRLVRMRSGILMVGLLCAASFSVGKEQPPQAPPARMAPPPLAQAVTPAPLAPMTPQEHERGVLMQAIFGEYYRPATRDALVGMPLRRNNVDTSGRFFIDAVSHSLLANGDTVLVANGVEMGKGGVRLDGVASPGFLNVFILRQEDGKWSVLKRHENIAKLGSFGSFGEVQWVTLGAGKPGMAVLTDGAWDGYFMHWLALFDPADEVMHKLGGMRVASGGQDDCAHEPVHPCWIVRGKWRFAPPTRQAAYDDLVFEFSGMHVRQRKPRNPALRKGVPDPIITPLKASARYAFDGKRYQLVEGKNPVPGLGRRLKRPDGQVLTM
ncbi:hypothetical protein [Massilia rubra]|uniref:Uncharacterized protein n=1 Tax=Massilia rubra TaxID=2607910 RepID=A0ABX0LE71_9BURK|nr:hypothetical protein [Massilia rubra]NHZ33118.1 hypothetical protein [Massilia rubra]